MIQTLREIHALLSPRERRLYRALLALITLAALLQVAGVASLAPFISLLPNPDAIHQQALLQWFYDHVPVANETQFIALVALAIIVLLVVTNVTGALAIWATIAFSMVVGASLSRDIYRGYLRQDYARFARSNTADLIATITQQTPVLVYMIIQPTLQLISQVLVLLFIAVALLYVDPTLALGALAVIGGAYGLMYWALKKRLQLHGENAWRLGNTKLRLLNESLNGIKEVKLVGTERHYEQMVDAATIRSMNSSTFLTLAGDLPRFMLETIAFGAMLGLAIYLLLTGEAPTRIVGVLSLYAMAGYKAMPAAQSIYKSLSSIKANQSVLDYLREPIRAGRLFGHQAADQPAASPKSAGLQGDIVLQGVDFTYPGNAAPALRDINIRLPSNRITALVGESGAGKSTLLDLLLGLLPPDSGSLQVGGTHISGPAVRRWQQRIGYVPQHIFLLDDSLLANICFGYPTDRNRDLASRAATLARLDALIAAVPGGLDYVIGERGAMLSGGQRQRVGIARALYNQPSVIVMDEATSALDSVTEKDVMNTVADLRSVATVVLVAHRASTIRYADHVVILNKGRVQDSGSFAEVYARNESFRQMMTAPEPDLESASPH